MPLAITVKRLSIMRPELMRRLHTMSHGRGAGGSRQRVLRGPIPGRGFVLSHTYYHFVIAASVAPRRTAAVFIDEPQAGQLPTQRRVYGVVVDEPPQKVLDRRHPELILPVARLKGAYNRWQ
jgi:hypothetical protein